LDSLLSDNIPYIVKTHYFGLLFEVYLKKIPHSDDSNRLGVADVKFLQVMKWVVLHDLENTHRWWHGLVVQNKFEYGDAADQRRYRQVMREVDKSAQIDYEEANFGKNEKDKADEKAFKAGLSSFQDAISLPLVDNLNKEEFWTYLYDYDPQERAEGGLLVFIERFYREYSVGELSDENM
jgi:hypothetical protein